MITSLFAGFNHAVRSMQNSQYALNVSSSNVANANDPNYTREQLKPFNETDTGGPGIIRLRDAFVDDQYRLANSMSGEATTRQDVLGKVEDVFGDPVQGGLRQAIDGFFDAWQGLAENPSDGVARTQVLIAGRSFTQQISSTYDQLNAIQGTVNQELTDKVGQVNDSLQQIFSLNKQISNANRNNLDDAALRDKRDKLLDDLSNLAGASAIEQPDGTVRVVVGSTVVVDGPTVMKLDLVNGPNGPLPTWDGYGTYAPVYNGKGTISGLVSVRDNELVSLKQDITTLSTKVSQAVNTQHAAGVGLDGSTGLNFFTGTPPYLQVANLTTDQVAAGTTSGPADGQNARALVAVGSQQMVPSVILTGSQETPATFYRNLVGWIGSQKKETDMAADVAKTHLDTSLQQRQTEFGVSVDEEVANISLQQKAFQASARVLSVMDTMLDTLINQTLR